MTATQIPALIGCIILVVFASLIVWLSRPKYAQLRRGRVERLEQERQEDAVARQAEYEVMKNEARQELAQLRQAKARGERVSRQHLAELEVRVRGYDAAEKMHAQRRYSGYRDDTGRLESSLWRGPARPTDPTPEKPQPAPEQSAPAAVSGLTRAERSRQWATVRSQFRRHLGRMASYETDPALAIDFPAFNDVTVPEVSAMAKALRTATSLEDATERDADVGGSDALLAQFQDAVHEFGGAVDTAERKARTLRWSHLPAADRDDLDTIQALMAHAMSAGNTDEARRTYYAKLQRMIRKLNDRHGAPIVPTTALAEIEDRARLALKAVTTKGGPV